MVFSAVQSMNNSSLVFTAAVQTAQAERGSAKAYEQRIVEGFPDKVTAELAAFIAEQDTSRDVRIPNFPPSGMNCSAFRIRLRKTCIICSLSQSKTTDRDSRSKSTLTRAASTRVESRSRTLRTMACRSCG